MKSNTQISEEEKKEEQNKYQNVINNELYTEIWLCAEAYKRLCESLLDSKKGLFLVDTEGKILFLKAVWWLWVFDLQNKKFGSLEIYIYI